VANVSDIKALLKTTKHNGFPVINSKNKLKGVVSRNMLIALLENEIWYNPSEIVRKVSIQDSDDSIVDPLMEYDSDDNEGHPE